MILNFCSDADVARMARVAFRYLEITTSMLYTKIETNEYSVRRMLCSRVSSQTDVGKGTWLTEGSLTRQDLDKPNPRINDVLSFGTTKQILINNQFFPSRMTGKTIKIKTDRLRWNEGEKLKSVQVTVRSDNIQ